ncbi:MAG: hypothetical protein IJW31_03195 [Lentisphaeria bacterium]|nr:hypothetical protein [Lentisphaeria bacterium]
MIKKLVMVVLGVSIVLFAAGGCMKKYYSGVMKAPPKTVFEPIANAKLELSIVGSRQLVSGIDDTVTFKLENVGMEISIPEWQEKDIDNLVIYYQDWLPGTESPNPMGWIRIEPIVMEPIKRYPLTLPTRSSVMITAGLPFLEGLKVTPGKERRFFVKAHLNLKSVHAESQVYAISVL